MDEWYYWANGDQNGPISQAALMELHRAGIIDDDTDVSDGGDWILFRDSRLAKAPQPAAEVPPQKRAEAPAPVAKKVKRWRKTKIFLGVIATVWVLSQVAEYSEQANSTSSKSTVTISNNGKEETQSTVAKASSQSIASSDKSASPGSAPANLRFPLKVRDIGLSNGRPCTPERDSYDPDDDGRVHRLWNRCAPFWDTWVYYDSTGTKIVRVLREQQLKKTDPEGNIIFDEAIKHFGPPAQMDRPGMVAIYGDAFRLEGRPGFSELRPNSTGIGLSVSAYLDADQSNYRIQYDLVDQSSFQAATADAEAAYQAAKERHLRQALSREKF